MLHTMCTVGAEHALLIRPHPWGGLGASAASPQAVPADPLRFARCGAGSHPVGASVLGWPGPSVSLRACKLSASVCVHRCLSARSAGPASRSRARATRIGERPPPPPATVHLHRLQAAAPTRGASRQRARRPASPPWSRCRHPLPSAQHPPRPWPPGRGRARRALYHATYYLLPTTYYACSD